VIAVKAVSATECNRHFSKVLRDVRRSSARSKLAEPHPLLRRLM
jgi:hypothetical protein